MNSSHPGERIREQRKALGWTQDQAAAQCGVSREMWGKYERGLARPGSEILAAMGKGGMDVRYILTAEPQALRSTLSDVKLSTEIAGRMGGTHEEINQNQERIFHGLRAARVHEQEEVALISDYRRCTPPDQLVIRQMASRLAGDAPSEQIKKKPRKKT